MPENFTVLSRWRSNYFLLLLILIHLAFLSVQIANKNLYLVDSQEYLTEADNILNTGNFYCGDTGKSTDYSLYTKRPPVYPLFIAFFKAFTSSDILIIITQSIISILSIVIIRHSFIQLGYNTNYDLLSLTLLILSPAQMIYANFIMAETIFQFIFALTFYSAIQFLLKKSVRYLLYFNILIGLLALTKPVMYLFIYPNLVFMGYFTFREKSAKPLLLGIIPVIIIQAYSFWNYKRTDCRQFSSIQTINLVQYNTYYFNAQRYGFEMADSVLDAKLLKTTEMGSYPERISYLNKSSKEIIKKDFWGYSWFHLKGVARFFIDPGRFDLSNFWGLKNKGEVGFLNYLNSGGLAGVRRYLLRQNIFLVVTILIITFVNLVKTAGLILFTLQSSIDIRVRLAIIVLVGYIALATGPLGASRFSMPFIPILIFSATTTIPELAGRCLGSKAATRYGTGSTIR